MASSTLAHSLSPSSHIVALDIGTSKIVIMMAEVLADGTLQVCGIGQHPTNGCMRKGMVVNIDATVEAIHAAIKEAQLMSNKPFSVVWTGIAGGHIQSVNSEAMISIANQEVIQEDIDRVISRTKDINISSEMEILETIPQEFIVDNQEQIKDPLGMAGARLKVKVHIVMGATTSISNISKCITRCGLHVASMNLQPLASANAVLSTDEKELGVILVDIGGGTTDIAIFSGGAVRHTAVIPVAGDHITNDIAMALRTPTADAEELKIRWGIAKTELVNSSERLEVPGLGDREPRMISRMVLASVIEPRVKELFDLIEHVVKHSGWEHLLSSGIVLTGGASLMIGMQELAEDVFARPVRIGMPHYSGNLSDIVCNPRFSTVLGLLLEAKKNAHPANEVYADIEEQPFSGNHFLKRITSWFGL